MSTQDLFQDKGDFKSGSTGSASTFSLSYAYNLQQASSSSSKSLISSQKPKGSKEFRGTQESGEQKSAIEKESQVKPKIDLFYITFNKDFKENISLWNISTQLRDLYKTDVQSLFSHLRQVIEKNAAGCLAELVCYAPLAFKEIEKQFMDDPGNLEKYTIVQYADLHNSKNCWVLLLLYGANGENMCRNMEPKTATRHSTLKR